MSRISDAILEKCVTPELNKKRDSVIAKVISYDPQNNTAKIQYTQTKAGGIIEMDNVTVSLEARGTVGAGLIKGDSVFVTFMNGNSGLPIITKVVDSFYLTNTREKSKHDRKGSFLPDALCSR